jgi:two-component system phosphate regulon sensor histidine kinase PhoR
MMRQKCGDSELFIRDANAMDTVPMYSAYTNEYFPFRYSDLKFRTAMNLEVVLKFEYLFDDTIVLPSVHNPPDDINVTNFREKFSGKEPITVRYDTLLLDTTLKSQLNEYSFHDKFHFGYVRSDNDKMAFNSAGANKNALLKSPLRVRLTRDKYFSQPHDLVMYLDNYQYFLLSSIRTQLIISGIVIIILVISFYLFARIIYKQRKLSEMKNDFINNMTHEFKTPLANISVAMETLAQQSASENEPNSKVYKILGQETERLRENIEKILQVARFEKEKIHLSFEKLDLHSVIQKAASSFEPVLEGRKAELKFDFNASSHIIEADETHLINIICNLIDNSIKYSTNGLQLLIKTENFRDGIMFSVKDNGAGISKESQKRIFERFYRANGSSDVHTVKGFGLGLSYVKTIVDSHQGKIIVRSLPNIGSEFQIYLPFNQ